MSHDNDGWPSTWYWSRDDLLILSDMFEPPVPFAEYNTDESLRRMDNDPLPWEAFFLADSARRSTPRD